MKGFKKLVAAAVIAGTLGVAGAAGTSYAAGATTPAGIVSALTGKSLEQVTSERAAGKTYGTIAGDAGKLAEFQAQMLEQKKELLKQRVAEGKLTQGQADTIYSTIQANQAVCDGTGSAGIGQGNGSGFGQGMGSGSGARQGKGGGRGRGVNCIFGVQN